MNIFAHPKGCPPPQTLTQASMRVQNTQRTPQAVMVGWKDMSPHVALENEVGATKADPVVASWSQRRPTKTQNHSWFRKQNSCSQHKISKNLASFKVRSSSLTASFLTLGFSRFTFNFNFRGCLGFRLSFSFSLCRSLSLGLCRLFVVHRSRGAASPQNGPGQNLDGVYLYKNFI